MLTRRSLRLAAYVLLFLGFGALLVLDTSGHRSSAAATTCLLVGDAAIVALLITDARGRRQWQADKRRDAAYYSARRAGASATEAWLQANQSTPRGYDSPQASNE